jgi:hypothetical protein
LPSAPPLEVADAQKAELKSRIGKPSDESSSHKLLRELLIDAAFAGIAHVEQTAHNTALVDEQQKLTEPVNCQGCLQNCSDRGNKTDQRK